MSKSLWIILIALACSRTGKASTLTVRDLKLGGNQRLEIALDGVPPKNSLDVEFVRDVVQFTIQNATIYPAKILHADASTESFSKVFAYQYAPSLVRIRFSVDGSANQFSGRVKWELKGKNLTITFPSPLEAKNKTAEPAREKSLLAKVLGTANSEPKVEKVEDVAVRAEQKTEKKSEQKSEPNPGKIESKAVASTAIPEPKASSEAIEAEAVRDARLAKVEAKKNHRLTGNPNSETQALGGAKPAPSMLRSFLAMILVVGGLGIVLIYVKKKKASGQASTNGDSWFSKLLHPQAKQKALIEVVGVHALGPKQSITVVRIRGQQLVLGVTEGNVQLITQLDSDEELDLMDDPKVADSLGKIFGAPPLITSRAVANAAPLAAMANPSPSEFGESFNSMLRNSQGAGASLARNAYSAQSSLAPEVAKQVAARSVSQPSVLQSSVRDQIKIRLQGMRNG